jgi:ribose/xylose/arabinose/galactoside ABC-type transport system permease subunit
MSINDLLFAAWIILCFIFILLSPGKISKQTYIRNMGIIFVLSCAMTIWFHEKVIDVSQSSPIHAGMLVFAQMITLTLTSKLWLSYHLRLLSPHARAVLYTIFYGALLIVIICSYWLYKLIPEVQLILYPFASLAISVTTQILENRWKKNNKDLKNSVVFKSEFMAKAESNKSVR